MKEPILEPVLRRIRFQKVIGHIRHNSVVVDIGCGHTPHFLNRLERFIKKGTGLDRSVVEGERGNIRLISTELNKQIPVRSNSADHVTLIAVLEHLKNPRELLGEVLRLLRPGGILLLTTPTPLNKPLLEFLAFGLGVVSRREISEHRRYYWKSELVSVLKAAGFTKIRHEYFELLLNNFVIAEKR